MRRFGNVCAHLSLCDTLSSDWHSCTGWCYSQTLAKFRTLDQCQAAANKQGTGGAISDLTLSRGDLLVLRLCRAEMSAAKNDLRPHVQGRTSPGHSGQRPREAAMQDYLPNHSGSLTSGTNGRKAGSPCAAHSRPTELPSLSFSPSSTEYSG